MSLFLAGFGLGLGLLGAQRKRSSSAVAPVNTVASVISGNVQVGQTLTATDGTWTGTAPIVYTYQWKRGASNITSATNSTYQLVEADAGATITCVVTGTNAGGNSTGTSNGLTVDVYLVYLTHIEDATDAAVYSGGVWSGVSFGVAASNRKLAILHAVRNSAGDGTLTSITIGGVTATAVVSLTGSGNTNKSHIQIADVPTGTSGNIVITWSTTQLRAGAGLYAIYGAGSSTASDTDSSIADPASVTLTVPAKGVAIGGGYGGNGVSASWTGLTENYDTLMEAGNLHSGASLNSSAGGNIAMSCDWSSTPSVQCPVVFASWGP